MRKTVTVFSCKWEELGNAKKKRSLFNEVLQSISNASVNEKTADAKKETHREKRSKERRKKEVFSVKGFYTILLFFPPQDTSIRTHFQCVAVSSLMAPLKPRGKKEKKERRRILHLLTFILLVWGETSLFNLLFVYTRRLG